MWSLMLMVLTKIIGLTKAAFYIPIGTTLVLVQQQITSIL